MTTPPTPLPRIQRFPDTPSCAQACLNMRELLAGEPATNRQRGCAVARIMLHARDAALSQSLQDAAARAGPGQTVAGVVGDAHMQGICEHWHHSLHADQAGPGTAWDSGGRSSADGHKVEKEGRQGGSGLQAGHLGTSEDAGLMGMRVALAESVLSLQVSLVHSCSACSRSPCDLAWQSVLLFAHLGCRLSMPVPFLSLYSCQHLCSGCSEEAAGPEHEPDASHANTLLCADAGGQHDTAVLLRGHCSEPDPGPDRSLRAGAGAVCQPAHASRSAGPSAPIAGAAQALPCLSIGCIMKRQPQP